MRPEGPAQKPECRTFGADYTYNPIPALRPGLFNAGPSDLKTNFFKK
jgi:hypothetical protein